MEEFNFSNKYHTIYVEIDKFHNKFIIKFTKKESKYSIADQDTIKGNLHFVNIHYYLLEPKLLNGKEFNPIDGIEGYKYIELMKFSHNMFLNKGDSKLLVDAQVVEKDFNFNSMLIIGFDCNVVEKGTYKLYAKNL